MDFFDKLGATLSSAGKDVSQKAKDLSGTAKLNLDIKAKEDLIQKQYTELGRIYYAAHKEDSAAEGINCIHAIREAEQEIARMKDEIMKIKGAVACPNCGAQLPVGTGFCGQCGTKITGAAPTPATTPTATYAETPAATAPTTYTEAPASATTYQSASSPMPSASQTYTSAPAQAAPTQGEVSSAPFQSEPAAVAPEMTEE